MITICGRYYIDDETYEIEQIVKEVEKRTGQKVKTGEVRPSDAAPVIRRSEGGRELAALKWGFPKWQGSGVIFNARAESAAEKQMFREASLLRRCVIPCSGFYEWSHEGGKAQDKYYLKRPGARVMYLAGVWSSFNGPDGEYPAYVVLTTQSNDSMIDRERQMTLFESEPAPIHDRMPVILEPDECDRWLSDDAFAREIMKRSGPELTMSRVTS